MIQSGAGRSRRTEVALKTCSWSARRLAAANDRAKLALVALRAWRAAVGILHFAAIARTDAGAPTSLPGRLKTVERRPSV